MSEEVKNVHREPHPFVGVPHIMGFIGRTIAFVGKVERLEEGQLIMKTAEGKYRTDFGLPQRRLVARHLSDDQYLWQYLFSPCSKMNFSF